jgi:hypothetical protein
VEMWFIWTWRDHSSQSRQDRDAVEREQKRQRECFWMNQEEIASCVYLTSVQQSTQISTDWPAAKTNTPLLVLGAW